MDGLARQVLKVSPEDPEGQEDQDLLGFLELKVSLGHVDILGMMEIWENQDPWVISVSLDYQGFLVPKVIQGRRLDSLVHLDSKDCQGRMDPEHLWGVLEIQVTQDTEEGQDNLDNQDFLENQEERDCKASLDYGVHQVFQVFQGLQVMKEVWGH